MCSVYLCLLLLYFWCSLCQLLILILQLILTTLNNYNETYSISISSWSESLFPCILSDIYITIMCSVYLCLLLLYFWCSLCQLLILILQLILTTLNNYNETYSISISSWSESLFPCILSDIYIIIMCEVCICVCYYCISGVHYINF